MSANLIVLNGHIIKNSISEIFGIYKKHISVTSFAVTGNWNVYIDNYEMIFCWHLADNSRFARVEEIQNATLDFLSKIKGTPVRKFVDRVAIISDTCKLIQKLNLEYKLDLLN